MTADELSELEGEFNLTLPADYRRAMLDFRAPEFAGNNHTYFWNDAKALRRLNQLVRRGLITGWPPHMFAIGKASDDDVVSAIDVESRDVPVFTFRVGQPAPSTQHLLEPRFEEFVRKYIAYAPELLKVVGGTRRQRSTLTWALFAAAAVLIALLLWRYFRIA